MTKKLKKITLTTGRKLLQFKLIAIFLKNSLIKGKKQVSAPGVWLDLSVDFERYIYILCKYFELEGYQVYVAKDWRFLVKLTNFVSRRLITEGRVIFEKEKPANLASTFTDRSANRSNSKFLSKDYFTTIFKTDKNSYHIPIGMHPYMYSTGLWNGPVSSVKRERAIFFSGKFKEEQYQELSQTGKFNMPNRIQLRNILQALPNVTFPKNQKEIVANIKDGQIDIAATNNYKVPQEILRQTIARYSFFIALPGFIMPQSHNVYEAMSVGTIPIIHRQYAKMFHPELEHNVTAVIYEDDFADKLKEALQIEPEHIEFMCTQVSNYYNEHLTPKAIVSQLLRPDISTYFLNAEKNSVLLMK